MEKMTIVVHSGDLDKFMSALIIGNGFLSMGGSVTMYFTFWGLQRLVRGRLSNAPLSRMHLFGLGAWMMRRKMKKAHTASPERLLEDFKVLGGRVIACAMTMDVMGIQKKDLDERWIDAYGAVGTYVRETQGPVKTLFI